MIIDCFPFFNEFDILKIRLHELDPWVDKFVLVESRETFSGNKKPLWFAENKQMFEEFLPKIIYLESPVVKDLGIPKNYKASLARQIPQKDYVMQGLKGCSDDDLIIIGDVDEIPKGRDFESLCKKSPAPYWRLACAQYFYFMNLYRPGAWIGPVIIPYKNIFSYFKGSPMAVRLKRRKGGVLQSGNPDGWHFTFMGGLESIQLKYKSYGHFKSHVDEKETVTLQRMKEGELIKGRSLTKVPIDNLYPKWFADNIKDFQHLLSV